MTSREYTAYCAVIPIGGAGDAISRAGLAREWGIDDRSVRRRISDLRRFEGDDVRHVICSSSHGGGYYRTANPDEVRRFIRETTARARHTFAPLAVANRVLERWHEDGTPRQLRAEIERGDNDMSMVCVHGGACNGCMDCLEDRPEPAPEPEIKPEPQTYADMLRAVLESPKHRDVYKFADTAIARRATQGMCMARRTDRDSFGALTIKQQGVHVHVWE